MFNAGCNGFTVKHSIHDAGALLASAVVKVTVNDVNDNVPVFDRAEYDVKLVAPTSLRKARAASAWMEIGAVRATDADSGMCGRVFYTIVGGNDDVLFSINQWSGKSLSFILYQSFNYEKKHKYTSAFMMWLETGAQYVW